MISDNLPADSNRAASDKPHLFQSGKGFSPLYIGI
jgi:hypothetical protein